MPEGRRAAPVLVVVCCALLAARTTRADPDTRSAELAEAVGRVLAREPFRGSTFGIRVVRLSDGAVLFDHGGDRLLPAASTTKLVSCAGAWLTLGPQHRIVTRVVGTGAVEEETLHGDLVLVAAGDPNLSQRLAKDGRLRFRDKDHSYAGFSGAELVEGDPLAVLHELARAVRARPISRVRGDIVVDDGIFAETEDPFVGAFSAASVNDQLVDVIVKPGPEAGAPVELRVEPNAPAIDVSSTATTVGEGERTVLWLEPLDGLARFELRGTMAVDDGETVRVAKPSDPGLLAAHLLAACLAADGITWEGAVRRARSGPQAYGGAITLAEHTSAPLSEAIRVILKTSQNLHATMLPPLIGAETTGRGTRAEGFAGIRHAFESAGLTTDRVTVGTGSGGGRADWLTSRWLTDLLRHLAAREDFPAFLDALPAGGVDGTIAAHFRSSRLVGRVHAKTGTLLYRDELGGSWLYLTKSLAGYLDLVPGRDVRAEDRAVFAIIIAGSRHEDRRQGTDELFRAQEDILRAVLDAYE